MGHRGPVPLPDGRRGSASVWRWSTPVHAHEEAKIRILNASHSCIAWAGALLGLRLHPRGGSRSGSAAMAFRYVTDDVIPCLEAGSIRRPSSWTSTGTSSSSASATRSCGDTNQRVATDSFSKMAASSCRRCGNALPEGQPVPARRAPGALLRLPDPLAPRRVDFVYEDRLLDGAAVHGWFQAPDPVAAYCEEPSLWGDLAGSREMTAAVREAHGRVQAFLRTTGAR